MKLPIHRVGLPGNEEYDYKVGAFLPAPAYGQEGGASSRLARENEGHLSYLFFYPPVGSLVCA